MPPPLNPAGLLKKIRTSTDSSSTSSSTTEASSMSSLSSASGSTVNFPPASPLFSSANAFKKRSGSLSRQLFSTLSSTSSIFSTVSNASGNDEDSGAVTPSMDLSAIATQVRRISVPFQKARRSAAARRLSHFVHSVGDAVNEELLVFNGEKPSGQLPFVGTGADLNREWEVVTVRELCRRLSLEDSFEPSEMPLPDGALQSQVLDEFMIRQIIDILPPRAEGYPWVNIYSSEKHGFSLSTLYRKMSEWTEEMSPVLLIIRDVSGHVFGAIASTALRPADHYYGTGDSCLLFRYTGEYPHTRELRAYTWTGENQFFVNASKDFLSMGAGGGHYGLWLDADLNHGRSTKCATFDNEPLAGGQTEDFVVQFVEAFGFSMA